MLLTYTYVRGEKQMLKLCEKMRLDRPLFTESFAHLSMGVTIERIFENPGDGYHEYFMFTMPHEKGTLHQTDASRLVHKQIREGEKGLRIV